VAASGGANNVAAVRLLEDLELGLEPSHHMASTQMRVQETIRKHAHPGIETRQGRGQINKQRKPYCAGVARAGWRRPRRGGGTRRRAAPSCNHATAREGNKALASGRRRSKRERRPPQENNGSSRSRHGRVAFSLAWSCAGRVPPRVCLRVPAEDVRRVMHCGRGRTSGEGGARFRRWRLLPPALAPWT
jgi:hypothetical protein